MKQKHQVLCNLAAAINFTIVLLAGFFIAFSGHLGGMFVVFFTGFVSFIAFLLTLVSISRPKGHSVFRELKPKNKKLQIYAMLIYLINTFLVFILVAGAA